MTLIERIADAIRNDDEDQSDRLQALFESFEDGSPPKLAINDAFICLCGYSLSTLILESK